jgi:hypothetical protein
MFICGYPLMNGQFYNEERQSFLPEQGVKDDLQYLHQLCAYVCRA